MSAYLIDNSSVNAGRFKLGGNESYQMRDFMCLGLQNMIVQEQITPLACQRLGLAVGICCPIN